MARESTTSFLPYAAAVMTAVASPSDPHVDLVDRCRAGDRSAAESLVRTYQPLVLRLGRGLLRRSDEIEDFSQEVFFKTLRSLDSFRGECSLRTWIIRIAINTSHNFQGGWLRRLRIFAQPPPDAAAQGLASMDAFPDRAAGPDGHLFAAEFRRELLVGLRALSAPLREAVVLRDLEGLSYEEIASVTSVNLNTVRSRIAAGRGALAKALKAALGPEVLRDILAGGER